MVKHHSLFLTVIGIVLFCLPTANTQAVFYIKVFATSSAIIATAPWVTQLIVSMAIIIFTKLEFDEDFDQVGASHRDLNAPGIVNAWRI